jgi:hypothetical protein
MWGQRFPVVSEICVVRKNCQTELRTWQFRQRALEKLSFVPKAARRAIIAPIDKQQTKSGIWYSFSRDVKWDHKDEGWEESFGSPGPIPEPENPSPPPPNPEEPQ